ncbi:hypothetical protein B0H16DRAFT_534054 [Mycena metata]|uniref:Uncharacterized protein n=1 Tax=Mycena metata TaxID=1033252 RepID=A0AAD7MEL4_9AGAR|nr:hypothetical protein B0H16DRAFT_534054 [Mycena metata]
MGVSRYKNAVALLFLSTADLKSASTIQVKAANTAIVDDSGAETPALRMNSPDTIPQPSTLSETEAAAQARETKAVGRAVSRSMHKVVQDVVMDVAKHEGKAVLEIIRKDGFVAATVAAPGIFATGLLSVLGSGAPRGTKRKAEMDNEDETALGAGPLQRHKGDSDTAVTMPATAGQSHPAVGHRADTAPVPPSISAPAPSAPTPTAQPPAPESASDTLRATTPSTAQPPAPARGPSAPARAHRARVPVHSKSTVTSPRSGPSVLSAVRTIEATLSGAAPVPTATPGAYALFRFGG